MLAFGCSHFQEGPSRQELTCFFTFTLQIKGDLESGWIIFNCKKIFSSRIEAEVITNIRQCVGFFNFNFYHIQNVGGGVYHTRYFLVHQNMTTQYLSFYICTLKYALFTFIYLQSTIKTS